MRYESTVTSLGWIPSEAIEGMMRLPIDIGVGHYDPPPPDHIDEEVLAQLVENNAIRFANRLSAWIEVQEPRSSSPGHPRFPGNGSSMGTGISW